MSTDIASLGVTTLNQLKGNTGGFSPALIQQEILKAKDVLKQQTTAVQGNTKLAADSLQAAATNTLAAAKQQTETAKTKVETVMKALSELSKTDPSVLLSL